MSIAGRRSANKGRSLFLTVASFFVVVVTRESAFFHVCLRAWSRIYACCSFLSSPCFCAVMTGAQGKEPTG